MPEHRIVDTNVLLVAAERHDKASERCQQNCARFLQRVRRNVYCVVLDANGDALNEYTRYARDRQTGDADALSLFLRHLSRNWSHAGRVRIVQLHKVENGNNEYIGWPVDAELANFDPNDRKWLMIALVFRQETGQAAPITYAIERDWDNYRDALTRHGVALDPLCAPHRHAVPASP